MPPSAPSLFLSADHLLVAALAIAVAASACALARRDRKAPWIRWFSWFLAGAQLVNAAGTQVWLLRTGKWTLGGSLPCQLCDAAIVAAVVALLRPSALAFELAYFWGMGAALQGLITPSITERWPEPVFVQFFVVHAGLPVAATLLAFGLGKRPRPGAVLRVMIWTNAVAVMAGLVSWATGGNYMFTRSPPPTGSLLDVLGPWPWYLVAAEVVALAVFSLLALPFVRGEREPAGLPA